MARVGRRVSVQFVQEAVYAGEELAGLEAVVLGFAFLAPLLETYGEGGPV